MMLKTIFCLIILVVVSLPQSSGFGADKKELVAEIKKLAAEITKLTQENKKLTDASMKMAGKIEMLEKDVKVNMEGDIHCWCTVSYI